MSAGAQICAGRQMGGVCDEDTYDARSGHRCAVRRTGLHGDAGRSIRLVRVARKLLQGCGSVPRPGMHLPQILSRQALLSVIDQLVAKRPASA